MKRRDKNEKINCVMAYHLQWFLNNFGKGDELVGILVSLNKRLRRKINMFCFLFILSKDS